MKQNNSVYHIKHLNTVFAENNRSISFSVGESKNTIQVLVCFLFCCFFLLLLLLLLLLADSAAAYCFSMLPYTTKLIELSSLIAHNRASFTTELHESASNSHKLKIECRKSTPCNCFWFFPSFFIRHITNGTFIEGSGCSYLFVHFQRHTYILYKSNTASIPTIKTDQEIVSLTFLEHSGHI